MKNLQKAKIGVEQDIKQQGFGEMLNANGILDRVSGLSQEFKLSNLAPQIAACRDQRYPGTRQQFGS